MNKWLPSLLVMLLIFAISSLPGKMVTAVGLGAESYHVNGHFFMFFVLGACLFKSTKSFEISILLGILYGILDEFHQLFVPGRAFELLDIGMDSFGVVLSVLIIWKFYRVLPKKLKNWLAK